MSGKELCNHPLPVAYVVFKKKRSVCFWNEQNHSSVTNYSPDKY